MKTKKRFDKVNFDIPEHLEKNFAKEYGSLKYLKSVLTASEGIEQINLLKEVKSSLMQKDVTEDELQLVSDALCTMLYQAPIKSSHYKALNRTIQEIFKINPLVIETCLQNTITTITSVSPLQMTVEEMEKSILHIICLIDDLTLGKKVLDQNADRIWSYTSLVLKTATEYLKQNTCLQKRDEYYDICQSLLKLVTHFIQNYSNFSSKSNTDKEFQASLEDMKVNTEYLLTDSETKLNCRLNAAFVYCNYYYYYLGEEKLKDMFVRSTYFFPVSSKLCIFSGIMATLPVQVFVWGIISEQILQDSLKISKTSQPSEIILLCARNVLQWTNVMLNVFNNESVIDQQIMSNTTERFSEDIVFLEMLFQYVLYLRDHFIDSLRHLSKDIFRNILNLHSVASGVELGKSSFLKEIATYLLKVLPVHNRGKYGILSCSVEEIGAETALEWDPSLPTKLYEALKDCNLVSHVSELCQVLFSSSSNDEDDKFQAIWLVPLLDVICKGSKEQISAVTQHILPKLLDVKPSSLNFLLSKLSSMWKKNIGNSFSALITCMKLHQKQNGTSSYLEFMSQHDVIKAFFHTDDQVRLSAFALLCESFKTTEVVGANTFQLIKTGLPSNINCQSPPFRQQLMSCMKKLFTRMIDSSYALMKESSNKKKAKNTSHKIILPTSYQGFLLWLKKYLFSCLHPGANFPRRVTSLSLLHILHEIFLESFPLVDSEAAVQTLLYAFLDTYDNNRLLALKLLSSKFSFKLNKEDEILFKSALTLASSTKPPDTATAAYLFVYIVQCPQSFSLIVEKHLSSLASQDSTLCLSVPDTCESNYDFHMKMIAVLMYELNKQFQLARNSLLEAAACAPLYGILTCIRSVLNDVKSFEQSKDQWQCLIKELITLSFNMGSIVEPVVSNSSPEGHLPLDTNNESIAQLQAAVRRALSSRFQSAVVQEVPSSEAGSVVIDIVKSHAVTAQILLLCCWRTHKEVSLLFGDISEKMPLFDLDSPSSNGVLCVNQMKDIGEYFLHQMSLVKHKGAFEQAHIGFSQICNRLWRCDIDKLRELPKMWLNDMILAIKGLKEDIQLCPTRRSAGLPFIIQAIMASEPCFSNSSFFKENMASFLRLAEPCKICPDAQVHALNVLRTLFRDACLGEGVMPFVGEGFKISIMGFKSYFWAVRNSSTLLFSALMTRAFGVNRSHDETGKKNRLTGKSFYAYYRDLYYFLIEELKSCATSLGENRETRISIQPSLYPILLILGRLYPAPAEEDTILSAFIPYLKICASSPIWKTRKLAAKALVAFTPQEKLHNKLQTVINEELISKEKRDEEEKFRMSRTLEYQGDDERGPTTPEMDRLMSDFDDYLDERKRRNQEPEAWEVQEPKLFNFVHNETHGKLLQILYFVGEIGSMTELEEDYGSVRRVLRRTYDDLLYFIYYRYLNSLTNRAALLEIYLYGLTSDVIQVGMINTRFFWGDPTFKYPCYIPDKDNFLSVAVATFLLAEFQYYRNDQEVSLGPNTPFIKTSFAQNYVFKFFIKSDFPIVKLTLLEIFLWFMQDDSEEYSLDSCDDIVVLQRVMKTVILLDKRKYDIRPFIDAKCVASIVQILNKPEPLLVKKVFQLLSYIPDSVSVPLKFHKSSQSCNLLNKLDYIFQTIDKFSREDVTSELLIYSSHVLAKLCEEYESCDKEKLISKQSDVNLIKKWLETVETCAYPDNSILLRKALVSILKVLVDKSLLPKSKLLGSLNLWQSLLLLLIDDEPEIRIQTSEIVLKMESVHRKTDYVPMSIVPSQAVATMLRTFIDCNYGDPRNCISILINWMMSSDRIPLESMNDEQPFDKGELNVFSEDLSLTDMVSEYLCMYITSQPSRGNVVLTRIVSCWSDNEETSLTYTETIKLCLSEANSILEGFLARAAVSPILDAYFEQELIQISQRLSVVTALFPFSDVISDFVVLGRRLLKNFESLNLRTYFIENIIWKIQGFLCNVPN